MIVKIVLLIVVVLLHSYESTKMQNCTVKCFFTTKQKDVVMCSSKNVNDTVEYVKVECDGQEDLTIGSLESVRSLADDFLSEMQFVRFLTLNLRLKTLEPTVLSSDKLMELKLVYVENFDQNSFINLPGLDSINFVKTNQLPEFFVLKYLERRQIITINIDIKCFKCKETSMEMLVFPKTRENLDNLYHLQSFDANSCPTNLELKYCTKFRLSTSNKTENSTHRFLKLNQNPKFNPINCRVENTFSISMFYLGLIVCLAIMLLIVCLLTLQLWTICRLRSVTKILKRLQFYPALADSELSDNNESNSYYGNNGILYQHNYPLSKT